MVIYHGIRKKTPTKQIQEIDWDHPIYFKSTVCPEQTNKISTIRISQKNLAFPVSISNRYLQIHNVWTPFNSTSSKKKTTSVPIGGFNKYSSWREVTSKRVYDFGSLPGAPTRGGAAVFNHLAIFGMFGGDGPTMGTFFFFLLRGDLNGDVF